MGGPTASPTLLGTRLVSDPNWRRRTRLTRDILCIRDGRARRRFVDDVYDERVPPETRPWKMYTRNEMQTHTMR